VKLLDRRLPRGLGGGEVAFLRSLGAPSRFRPVYEQRFSGLGERQAIEEGLRIYESALGAPETMQESLFMRSISYFLHALAANPDAEEAHQALANSLFAIQLSRARAEGCRGVGEPFFLRALAPRSQGVGVLLIHDFGAKPGQMRDLASYLNDSGYTTYGLRLPGHGQPLHTLAYSSARQWFEAAEEGVWLLKESATNVVTLGQGVGGILALLLAAHLREVGGVVSLAAPVRMKARWITLMPLLEPFIKYRFQKLYNEHSEVYHRYMPTSAIAAMGDLIRHYTDHLARVTCPVMLLQSRLDDFSNPLKSPKIIQSSIHSSTCRIRYVGQKYVLAEKNPDQEEINDLIADFINEITGLQGSPAARRRQTHHEA